MMPADNSQPRCRRKSSWRSSIYINVKSKIKIKSFFKKLFHFLDFEFAPGGYFIVTSLAFDIFFCERNSLQKLKMLHRLCWGNISLDNLMFKRFREKFANMRGTNNFFDRGHDKCNFRSIALGSGASLYNCSTNH